MNFRKTALLFGVAILHAFFLSGAINAQQTKPTNGQGAVLTAQVNDDYYVQNPGGGFYPTIQMAVTATCALAFPGARVIIPPSSTPSDTIAGVTGGCPTVSIIDQRVVPAVSYAWSGSAYVAVGGGASFSQSSALASASFFAAPINYFSDSQGAGTGSSASQFSIQGILNASHGGQFNNYAKGGNQAGDWTVDESEYVPYGEAAVQPGAPLPVTVIQGGVNNCSPNAGCLDGLNRSLNFDLAWAGMTMAQANRVFASAMTLSGGFALNTGSYVLPVALSTTSGSVASGSITTTGNPIGIEYVATLTNTGQLSCTLNGGAATVINEYPLSGTTSIVENHAYVFWRSEISATAGTYTVACTAANNTGTGNFAAVVAFDTIPVGVTSTLPTVILSNAPGVGGSDAAGTPAYNTQLTTTYNAALAEGLNLLPIFDLHTISNSLGANGYSTTYAPCPQSGAGGLHFNNCIHLAAALGYVSAYPQVFTYNNGPTSGGAYQSFGSSSIPNTNYYSNCNMSSGFTTTGINPCGYMVYPGAGMDFGAFTAGYPEFQGVGNPYLRTNQCWWGR